MSSSATDREFDDLISREIGEPRPAPPAFSVEPDAAAPDPAVPGAVPPAPAKPAARRGRPRSEAVEDSIVEGMLRLLEGGSSLAGMSVEAIAAEAGVGKATIYRRWPDKEAMLLHLLCRLEAKTEGIPQTGTVRDRLVGVLEAIRTAAVQRRSGTNLALIAAEIRAIPALYSKYHDTLIAPRRDAMRELMRVGQASGELRGDLPPDLLAELFAGPMLARAVLHPDESVEDPSLSATIVDAVLAGVAGPGAGSRTGEAVQPAGGLIVEAATGGHRLAEGTSRR